MIDGVHGLFDVLVADVTAELLSVLVFLVCVRDVSVLFMIGFLDFMLRTCGVLCQSDFPILRGVSQVRIAFLLGLMI